MNKDRQTVIASAVGSPRTALADIVAALISRLGLPTQLRDAGVPEKAMADDCRGCPFMTRCWLPIPGRSNR